MSSPQHGIDVALERLAESPNNEEAWGTLYHRLWPFVFSICLRMIRAPEIAEDLTQETFLRIARYFPFQRRFDEKVFMLYIAQVARRVTLDALHRRDRASETTLDALAETADPAPRPGEAAEVASTLEWLVRQLSPADAELFRHLVKSAPLSPVDIASDLGVSYSAAGVRLHRLRARIRKLLRSRTRDL
jgi:RNA polymerase sigma-70 factor (ECF subfamily)